MHIGNTYKWPVSGIEGYSLKIEEEIKCRNGTIADVVVARTICDKSMRVFMKIRGRDNDGNARLCSCFRF